MVCNNVAAILVCIELGYFFMAMVTTYMVIVFLNQKEKPDDCMKHVLPKCLFFATCLSIGRWIRYCCYKSYLESQESQGAHDSTARHHRRQHWTRRNRHSLDDLDPVPAQAMDLIIPEPRLMLQSVPVSVISTSNQPHNLTHHHPVSWIPETASRTATIIPMDSQPNSIFGNSLPMESIPDLPPPAYSEIGSPGPPSYDEALKLPNMK